MLKRKPSLTEQAKSYIKERILNDAYNGGRIPSETDLAEELGVSRTTIRDALSRLEIEGVITRKQGAGTFINKAGLQISSRLEEIWCYEDVLEAHGYRPSTQILSVSADVADARTAADLQVETGTKLIAVRKLFLAGKEPVILAINRIPASLITRPYDKEDFHRPLYEFLREFSGRHLAYYLSEIVPTTASSQLAKALHLRPQTAVISFEETGYDESNVPIVKAQSFFRDDLLRLRLIRREAV